MSEFENVMNFFLHNGNKGIIATGYVSMETVQRHEGNTLPWQLCY